MPNSIKTTSAEALQAFVQDFSPDLIGKSFYGNQTAAIATPHTGVKGKKILTILELGDIGHRWAEPFTPNADTLDFRPRTLEVEAGTFEMLINPQKLYDSYLAEFHRGTFNDSNLIPFEGYILNAVAGKKAQEIERSWWRGDKAASPATADKLWAVINGWLTLITDDLASGSPKLTATPTSGGALTTSNTIQTIEAIFDTMDVTNQDSSDLRVFVSPKVWTIYQRQYRNDYGKYTDNDERGRMKLDFCDAELVRTPGMGTSSRIVVTNKNNLHYGYDGITDASAWHFENYERTIKMWCDFLFGVEFGIFETGWVGVNDLP